MSNTFNVFRKYQKQFMTVLLLVAMFTFVIGTPLAAFLSTPMFSRGQGEVAVTWKGGKLTESSLHNLRENHNLLMLFVKAVVEKAQASGGQPKVTPPRQAASEEDIVLTLIKAQKAEQMGLVVTEGTMINYLQLLSDTSLRPEQMNAVMHEATGGRLKERAMFMQLRTELLAQKLEALALVDLRHAIEQVQLKGEQPFAIPPSMAWEYFNRMHRRVRAEMYPLKVTDFVDQVKSDPTEAQVKELYEKHKDEYPDPYSPDPGFKQNGQVAFQYVKIDFNKLLKEEKAKVTDKEIVEYYEKNKATAYVEVDLPEIPGEKPADKDPEDKKPEDKKPEDNVPEGDKPDEKKPEEKKPDDKQPENEKKPEEKKPELKKEDAPEPKDEKKPEGCQDDPAKTDPKDPDAKPEPKKEDPAKTDPANPDDPKAETPDKKSDDESEKPKEPVKTKPKKKEIKYKPLTDKLKEDIRGQIAQPLAETRRKDFVKKIQDTVRDYGRELRRWEAVNKLDTIEKDPKPADLDVKQMARSLGLGWGETPLIDPLEMLEDAKRNPPKYELSKTKFFDRRSFNFVDFANVAFGPGVPLFEPQEVELFGKGFATEEMRFIFWRTEEKPAFVPELKDVRDKVVEAWKKQAAFALAEKAANALAETVGKSGKSIRDSLTGDDAKKAFETDSFSWLSRNTPMGSPGQLGISRIKKLDAAKVESFPIEEEGAVDTAGEEFMAAVFSLHTGESGVAVNEPKTEVYVVRIINEPISQELLTQMFLENPSKNEIYMLAFMDRRQQIIDWQRDLRKDLNIKWKRDPFVSDRM